MSEETERNRADGEGEISKTAHALFRPSWIRDSPSLWPGVRDAMASRASGRPFPRKPGPRSEAQPFSNWAWAAASALAIACAAGLVLIGLRSFDAGSGIIAGPAPAAMDAGPRVEVLSSALAGTPARAFLFQTTETSFIWLAPSKTPETIK
jgi:hypothetical protein